MLKLLNVVAGSLLIVGLLPGCNSTPNSTRSRSPDLNSDAFAIQRDRENYVESNYQLILKSGRVANETEARVLAAQDWEAHERHRSDRVTTRWSSRDQAIREQKQFEEELSDLERK